MMYEDDTSAEDQEQVTAMSNLAAKSGGIDLAQLGDPAKVPGLLQSLYTQQMGALAQQEASDKKRFEAGEARIKARNQGLTQSEQLFMLSKALLAPRKYTGIGGTIGKISGAFSDISDAERKAREQRDAQLAQFQDAYMEKSDGYGVKRAQTAADLVKTAAPLLKKPAASTASRVTVGPDARVRSRATGVELKEPPIDKIYAFVNYMKNPANTPENKAITRQNFDKEYGYGSGDVYYEGQQ
jgi:hypothetical protein